MAEDEDEGFPFLDDGEDVEDEEEEVTDMDANSSDENDQESNSNGNNESTETVRVNQPRQMTVSYDTCLPATHGYFGRDFLELHGRIVLDDQSLVQMPIISISGVVLFPGQVLPLQLDTPMFIQLMKRIINKDRTFGLTSSLKLNSLGTTVEIRSFAEDLHQQSGISILRLKAEGRQRFKIIELNGHQNGILMGKVRILPESDLTNPLYSNCLQTNKGQKFHKKLLPLCTRWPLWVYRMYDPNVLMDQINFHLNSWASSGRSDPSGRIRTTTTRESTQANVAAAAASSGQPEMSNMRVTRTITTTIHTNNEGNSHEENEDSENSDAEEASSTPSTPADFSYWVAKNLPLEDSQRLQLLSLNSPIQRLRWELSILKKYLHLCCSKCKTIISHRDHIFSMSVQGPQDTYVNPSGYIHDTLTVYKAKSLVLLGQASSEYSWFPGYQWTICKCESCGNHMGWKFTHLKTELRPPFFWGLSRSSIEPTFKDDDDEKWIATI